MSVLEQDQEKDQKRLSVFIAYNGMIESFGYKAEQHVEATRQKALDHYDIRGADRDQNFLFGPDNQTELQGDVAMGTQVQPGSQLHLRPRTAGGG